MPRLAGFPTDCTISFDGERIPARTGEPVAIALLAAGRLLVSRSAKYHRPRGAFCLAGSCGTCLVRAGGAPNRRACRTPCREGLEVETQNAFPRARHDLLGVVDALTPHGLDHHHLATWSALANRAAVSVARRLAGLGHLPSPPAVDDARAAAAAAAPREERFDALVVGAGPAGLAAAEALAEAGRRVLLAEQERALGGRLRCRVGEAGAPDLAWGDRAATRVRGAGGEVATGTAVLGLWHDGGEAIAALASDGASPRLRLARADRIVLCPGGHPQPLLAEGGDRPGVFGARGLAAAIAEHGAVAGRRVAVVGAGAEADALAAAFARTGLEVERAADVEGGLVRGRARVRALELPGRTIACDTIAVASPPAPATELARELGASIALASPASGTFAVRASADGATGVRGLLAAGEVTGAMDAAHAADAGRRAGEAARG
ncbi:MAG TPA: 2Fe-2S iron-sulfur cluster-binding protein [Anaeromyxobacter sp.]|nr:2Fe-2S iron-sulfur cluster-binding protein [Anaeromyxobacter sp.]